MLESIIFSVVSLGFIFNIMYLLLDLDLLENPGIMFPLEELDNFLE